MELANQPAEGIGPSRPTPTMELASAIPTPPHNATPTLQLALALHQWTNSNVELELELAEQTNSNVAVGIPPLTADDQPGAAAPDRTDHESTSRDRAWVPA